MNPYYTKFQKFELFYVISSFRKAILKMNYDYGTKFNRGKINTTKIQLPTIYSQMLNSRFRAYLKRPPNF